MHTAVGCFWSDRQQHGRARRRSGELAAQHSGATVAEHSVGSQDQRASYSSAGCPGNRETVWPPAPRNRRMCRHTGKWLPTRHACSLVSVRRRVGREDWPLAEVANNQTTSNPAHPGQRPLEILPASAICGDPSGFAGGGGSFAWIEYLQTRRRRKLLEQRKNGTARFENRQVGLHKKTRPWLQQSVGHLAAGNAGHVGAKTSESESIRQGICTPQRMELLYRLNAMEAQDA